MKKGSLLITIVVLVSIFFVMPMVTNAAYEVNNVTGDLATSTSSSSNSCTTLLGSPSNKTAPAYYLVIAFKVIKYVAIILLIVLTIMDFLGPIASQNQDALKKATSKAIKRLVFCIIIWILPTLLEVVLEWFNEIGLGADCLNNF